MELQIKQFWIFTEHSMINAANEYEPEVLNPFCARQVWKLKILQRMYELISAFATQKFFAVFERQNLLEYYTQRAKNSPCIKFH